MILCRKFIMGQVFEREWRSNGLTDEDLRDLQTTLLENPKTGEVMKKTGRLRKLRISYGNRGKSHCARVCYVDFEKQEIIFLMMIFTKNETDNLTDNEKNEVKKMIERLEKSLN